MFDTLCIQSVTVVKEYNLKRYYETNHKNYNTFANTMRDDELKDLKTNLD